VYANRKPGSSTGESEAQETAIAALAWLAQDAERLQRFLAVSGLGPQNLRSAAAEPGFLAAVLDYLAANEALLIAFAADQNRAPESVMQARQRLIAREAQDDS
jgi:uncharacterized protein DUF3572